MGTGDEDEDAEAEEKKEDVHVESNGHSKGKGAKHVLSKSVGGLFGGKGKKQDDERYSKHQHAQSQAKAQVNEAVSKVKERGKKLADLADRSDQMRDSAQNFNDLAKQLANKKW